MNIMNSKIFFHQYISRIFLKILFKIKDIFYKFIKIIDIFIYNFNYFSNFIKFLLLFY